MITSLIQLFLAIVVLVGAYVTTKRLRNLEDTLYAVTGENEALQKKVVALEKALAEVNTPVEEKTTPVPEEPVAPAPEPPVPQEEPAAAPADTGLTPEVVAVIMATIAAYGYSPAAIRSIRKTSSIQRSQNWLMAGRMANMR